MNDIEKLEERNEPDTRQVVIPQRQDPNAMIQLALSQGQDLDKLEKLLELQIRYEENEAKKAYHEAMAAFKKNPPKIDKNKHVKYLKVDYHHASLANVTNKINIALSEHGLSATWSTSQDAGNITVTCTITHKFGHSESTGLTAAPDDSGSKNSIQAIGSTVSYLQRYTILALTGLATHDQDDDGSAAGSGVVEYISDAQLQQLREMINKRWAKADAKKINTDILLEYMQVKELEEIRTSDFKKAMDAITPEK